MSLLVSAAETIGTLVAAGFAAHKVENLLIRTKVIPHPLEDELGTTPPAIQAKLGSTLDQLWRENDAMWTRVEDKLFAEVPSAWWLDPERWGPREKGYIDDGLEARVMAARKICQNCGSTKVTVGYDSVLCHDCSNYRHFPVITQPIHLGRTQIRGNLMAFDGVTAPDAPPCPVCKTGRRMVMAEHDGEASMWDCFDCGCEFTRAGETKKSRKARLKREADMLPDVMMHPPRITEQEDKTIHRARRDLAWEYRAAECFAGRAENHGSCPEPCGMPVDKRGGMYYCSDSGCKRHTEGWK